MSDSEETIFSCFIIIKKIIIFMCRPQLLQALISLFELPEDVSVPDDEHFIEVDDISGISCTLPHVFNCF